LWVDLNYGNGGRGLYVVENGGKRWKWREGTGGNAVAATSGRRVAAEGRVAIIAIFFSPPAPPLASLYIRFRLGPPGK
jgi:hypothetical protein